MIMNKKLVPVLFIDRDGVINHMVSSKSEGFDSPQRSEDVRLVKGIADVIVWLNKQRIPVIEITNQPGVAKGKMDMKTLESIEARVHDLLKQSGVTIDYVYRCLHHPRGVVSELTVECDCRKPKPGLLIKAAAKLHIDLKRSIMLGDNASDVEAGKNAGCKTIIFIHEEDTPEKIEKAKKVEADFKITKISEIIPILENFFTQIYESSNSSRR